VDDRKRLEDYVDKNPEVCIGESECGMLMVRVIFQSLDGFAPKALSDVYYRPCPCPLATRLPLVTRRTAPAPRSLRDSGTDFDPNRWLLPLFPSPHGSTH
jgi:hypothetical protein